jgi:DNA-binding transcriptional regulator YiaG
MISSIASYSIDDIIYSSTREINMTNAEFDRIRREAEITSAELAAYAGATPRELLMVETGKAPVQGWMVKVLNEMIEKRAA